MLNKINQTNKIGDKQMFISYFICTPPANASIHKCINMQWKYISEFSFYPFLYRSHASICYFLKYSTK